MGVQMQGRTYTCQGVNSETAASDLVQATVDLGQHVADNLETVIRTFREDTEQLYQQAQRLHEAVRHEQSGQTRGQRQEGPIRQHLSTNLTHQEQPQENASDAHSHPIHIVQEPLEILYRTSVPEETSESQPHPQAQLSSEDPGDEEEEEEEEPRLCLRGGVGDDSDTSEELQTPEQPDTPEASTSRGDPMTMAEFDNRIGKQAHFECKPKC
jgi:hypothetical protein